MLRNVDHVGSYYDSKSTAMIGYIDGSKSTPSSILNYVLGDKLLAQDF
jgi:hypothetical protein